MDSNNPLVWHHDGAAAVLTALSSWGGQPTIARGATIESLRLVGDAGFVSHPGHGVWFEAVVPDADGRWYGFYHHERPADDCRRPDRQLPRIGMARSADQGAHLGGPRHRPRRPAGQRGVRLRRTASSSAAWAMSRPCSITTRGTCTSTSVSTGASQRVQGVAAARLAWADRDAPAGKVTIWNDGAWLPAQWVAAGDATPELGTWIYPAGTPLVRPSRPFHDGQASADVFWGPSIHWNTYLEQYVMLLNRAKDEQFGQDGIYVSFAPGLGDPGAWSPPARLLGGGGWYPQVAGLETGAGSDRLAGRRARLFITGASSHVIEFER